MLDVRAIHVDSETGIGAKTSLFSDEGSFQFTAYVSRYEIVTVVNVRLGCRSPLGICRWLGLGINGLHS